MVDEERKQKEPYDDVDIPERISAKVGMNKTSSHLSNTGVKLSTPLDMDSDDVPNFDKVGEDIESIPIKIITSEKLPITVEDKLKSKSPSKLLEQIDEDEEIIETCSNLTSHHT